MIRRIVALALKELSEHILVLLFLLVLLGGGWFLFLAAAIGAPTTVTYLEAHGNFARFALPMAAMALGNRLVVVELQGRTQRFLESLPMRPFEPLLVKWLFGAMVLSGLALASLAGAALVAAFREPIDASFLGLVALRTLTALLSSWSFFFAMGLFGKLRVPLYLGLFLALMIITSSTSVELMRFGPFMLLGPDLALERHEIPWRQLAESAALGALFLAVSGAVTLLFEGSVEERLNKPMSQRDLAFAGIASFALLTLSGELSPPPQPLPYVMASDHVLHAAELPIAIGYLDDAAEPDARALLARLEHDVGTLARGAGFDRLPQLRVVLRRSLDGRIVEPVGLSPDDGVLLRANFLSTAAPDLTGLSAAVISAMLERRTRGRSRLEPRRWLEAGLATFWASQGSPPGDPERSERVAHLRWITRHGAEPSRLHTWERLVETEGPSGASVVAASRVAGIAAAVGDPGLLRLVPRAFAEGATDDLRAVLHEWMDPWPRQLSDTTGLDVTALDAGFRAELERASGDPGASELLRALGEPSATLSIEDAGGLPELVVRANAAGQDGRTVTVRHLEVGPFDRAIEDHEMQSESVAPGADGLAEVRIVGRYDSGSRVLVVVDLEGSPLGAPVRLLAERRVLP